MVFTSVHTDVRIKFHQLATAETAVVVHLLSRGSGLLGESMLERFLLSYKTHYKTAVQRSTDVQPSPLMARCVARQAPEASTRCEAKTVREPQSLEKGCKVCLKGFTRYNDNDRIPFSSHRSQPTGRGRVHGPSCGHARGQEPLHRLSLR